MRTGTSLAVYPRAGNRSIGGKCTGHEGTQEIPGTKGDEFSIWTNGVGITSSILLRGDNAVEKSNNGNEPTGSRKSVIVERVCVPYTAVEVVSFIYPTWWWWRGNLMKWPPVWIGTLPRMSMPSSSQRNLSDRTADAEPVEGEILYQETYA